MDYSEFTKEEIIYAMNASVLQLKILLSHINDMLRHTEIYDARFSMDVIDGISVLDMAIIAMTKEHLLSEGYSEQEIIYMTEQARKAFGYDPE